MRALQRLSKKIMSCILAFSLFLSTGISSVFASEIVTVDTLKQNLNTLKSGISTLSNKSIQNENIKAAVDNVIDSLSEVNDNKISIYAVAQSSGNKYNVTLDLSNDSIDYGMEVKYEENKIVFNNGAQELTTAYIKTISSISSIVDTINKANQQDSSIDILEGYVTITLNNITNIIRTQQKLYNEKINELDQFVSNLNNYNSKIENNIVRNSLTKLNDDVNLLDSIYENEEVDLLLENINNELSKDLVSIDNYNNYLEQFNKLLDSYVDNSTTEILNKILEIDIDSDNVSDTVLNIEKDIEDLKLFNSNSEEVFNLKLQNKLNEYKMPTTEEERVSGLNDLNKIKLLSSKYNDEVNQLLNEKIELYQKSVDADLQSLTIQGFKFDKDALDSGELNLYVAYDVKDASVELETSSDVATYEITGNTNLMVGENTITVTVTAENGNTKTYKVIVNRMEQYVEQGDVTDNNEPQTNNSNTVAAPVETPQEDNAEDVVALVNNTVSNKKDTTNNKVNAKAKENENAKEKDEEKKSNTSDSKDKYNEELKDEDMSPLTILLIVAGIALVGFGIYMLFGKGDEDEEDIKAEIPKKEEKVEIKKVEIKDDNTNNKTKTQKTTSKQTSTNKNSSNKKNTKNKK